MADKSKFKFAAFLSMGLLFSIYFPTAASGYLSLGDCVEENVINGLSDGALKKADHLISIRMTIDYSIVTESSADLWVIFRICPLIVGKVCLLTLIEDKRQTLPAISVHARQLDR